jgi:hypothetical protein
MLLNRVHLSSSSHCIDRLGERTVPVLRLLFVSISCTRLIVRRSSQVLSGHGLRKITVAVIVAIFVIEILI